MDGIVHSEALAYFDYTPKQLPLITAYRTHTFEIIIPEVRLNFKTQTIKQFIYGVIEEDWDLLTIGKYIPLDTLITHNVKEEYISGKKEE